MDKNQNLQAEALIAIAEELTQAVIDAQGKMYAIVDGAKSPITSDQADLVNLINDLQDQIESQVYYVEREMN